MHEQILLMLQHPIQTPVQPIFLRNCKVLPQQNVHGAVIEPLPVQMKLAARIDQPIHHQQLQHLRQATPSLPRGNFSDQNQSSCNCRHSSHPSQQFPYGRARSSFISLSFTCTLSMASAGSGRSSGNRLSGVYRCCPSSNTSSVLRHAACWLSLISPRYKTCRCDTFPDCRRRLSTTV